MTSQLNNRVPLFAGLGPPQVEALEERLTTVQFGPGEWLFRAGDSATRMLLIESGWVRLVTNSGVALATLGPGSTLGDQEMLTEQPYASGAQAVGAVTAQALTADNLQRLVQRDPGMGLALSKAAGLPIAAMRSYVLSRLQAVPGWRRASRAALLDAEHRLTVVDAPAGQRLQSAGDPPDALYIVEAGQVRLSDPTGMGDIAVGASSVFGDTELLTGMPVMRNAEVLQDTVLWSLNAESFAALTAEYPELRATMSQELRAPLSPEDQKVAAERLRQLPTFSRWPDDVLADLVAGMLLQHVPAGETVYRKGDAGNAMYLVERGQIELHSDEEMLARLTAGNDFGEMALVTGRPRTAMALAATDVNLWVLSRSDFERVLSRNPAVQAAVTETVAQRLASADEAFFNKHLRKITLLSGLSRSQIEAVRRRLQAARYRAGEVIFYQGDEPEGLYLIERGQVRIDASGAGGPVAQSFTDGEIFGEGALLLEGQRSSSAQAVTDTDLWLLRRDDFEDLMLQYPSLALNLSRVLEERLRTGNRGVPAAAVVGGAALAGAAVAAKPAGKAAAPVAPASQPVAATPVTGTAAASQSASSGGIMAWFQGIGRVNQILIIAVVLLGIILLGCVLPYNLLIAQADAAEAEVREITMAANLPVRGGVEVPETSTPQVVALAGAVGQLGSNVGPTATYTPWPTETPIPTNTPTVTPTPTFTPTPTDTPLPTPTFTPVPTNTPVPTARPVVVRQAEPEPEVQAAAAAPAPAVEWRVASARRLSPCENRGKHNIFVKVLDAGGNPVDGLLVVQSNMGNPGDILDRMPSGTKGPGEAEFIMWKLAQYSVFIANPDGSPASTEFAQPLHSNFTDEANCDDGGGGNTLFHNSFEVIFQRTS